MTDADRDDGDDEGDGKFVWAPGDVTVTLPEPESGKTSPDEG